MTDALLTASRVLVAIASRSIAGVGRVTLPQFRALVVLRTRGPQSAQQLADELGVAASTVSRMGDRLVAKELIERETRMDNRREVRLQITAAGAEIVATVTRRRRRELRAIVADMPAADRQLFVRAVESFNAAAGENSAGGDGDRAWYLGWA